MKTQHHLFCLLLVFSTHQRLLSQCTNFVNIPESLQVPLFCDDFAFSEVDVLQAHAYLMEGLNTGAVYEVNLCFSSYPLPPNQMELVIMDPFNQVVTQAFDCFIAFEPPVPGDYLLVFNQAGNCGVPDSLISGFGIEMFQSCPCLLERPQVVELLLEPFSGFEYTPVVSNLWSPFVDFGFGPGFEGLIPQGTLIEPFLSGFGPFPGGSATAPFDAYFFWVDDLPMSGFQHPTRFVLVDPSDCFPTVGNGSILISEQGWWPRLTPPLEPPQEFFNNFPISNFPPGPDNPDGLIDGIWFSPNDILIEPNPPANNSTRNSAAIVVAGDNRSDFLGDVPRWRKQLQDEYGVDSTRILGTSNDSAVTKAAFCAMLDSLCTMNPAPDTIYIRISTHGSIGSLCFVDGFFTSNQLCEKFKKIAKKGVPVMLFIDACNSASLYDANNWGLPAGSMIIVGAASGRTALGAPTASLADTNGNAIPGTSFTGGMLSTAHILCKKDTTDSNNDGKTDADTNRDGEVDDCEAFNWLDTQKPCFVTPWPGGGNLMVGSYTITQVRLYPAGPPPGFAADTTIMIEGRTFQIEGNSIVMPNPMPSYRPVGNFGRSMNWNVQNMSGANKDRFYMTFCGNVSDGFGRAWTSTASDSLTGEWANIDNVTASYDAATDQTTVCWMASGAAAANGDYIHFGYFGAQQKLRPKRQTWDIGGGTGAPGRIILLDPNSVPTTQSSIHLDASGSPLTVKTVNLNAFQGGTGHPVNYTIGYRVSPVQIPLPNLTLSDPLVSALPLIYAGTGVLDTNAFFEFQIPVPDSMQVGQSLILQVELDWTYNGNTNTQLIQWPALDPAICADSIIYVSGETVPPQSNSDGTITLQDVIFNTGVTTLNAKDGVFAEDGAQITMPTGAQVFVYRYGCTEDLPLPAPPPQQLLLGADNQIMFRDIDPSVIMGNR